MPFSFSLSRRSSHASTSSAGSASSHASTSTAPSSPSSFDLPTFKPSSFELLEPISPDGSEELYSVEMHCADRKGKGKARAKAASTSNLRNLHSASHGSGLHVRRASTCSTSSCGSSSITTSSSSPRCNASSAGSFKTFLHGPAVCPKHGIVHNAALAMPKRELSSESGRSSLRSWKSRV